MGAHAEVWRKETAPSTEGTKGWDQCSSACTPHMYTYRELYTEMSMCTKHTHYTHTHTHEWGTENLHNLGHTCLRGQAHGHTHLHKYKEVRAQQNAEPHASGRPWQKQTQIDRRTHRGACTQVHVCPYAHRHEISAHHICPGLCTQ